MGTLQFVAGAVAMVLASVFADGTAQPMTIAICACAVIAFLLTQLTMARRATVAAAAE